MNQVLHPTGVHNSKIKDSQALSGCHYNRWRLIFLEFNPGCHRCICEEHWHTCNKNIHAVVNASPLDLNWGPAFSDQQQGYRALLLTALNSGTDCN